MKKIMIASISALVLSTSAMAEQRPQHHRHHHRHHHGGGPYYSPHSSSGAMFGLGFGMAAPRPY